MDFRIFCILIFCSLFALLSGFVGLIAYLHIIHDNDALLNQLAHYFCLNRLFYYLAHGVCCRNAKLQAVMLLALFSDKQKLYYPVRGCFKHPFNE